MTSKVIRTENAPTPVGPYSQAIHTGNLVYTAGQVALDPASGKLIEGDVAAQTERVLRNLQAVLEAADSSLAQVVKTTVYLQDLADFADMNEVYGRFFANNPPARTTIQVAALPLGARVEIEAVALTNA